MDPAPAFHADPDSRPAPTGLESAGWPGPARRTRACGFPDLRKRRRTPRAFTWREPIRRSPKSYSVYDNGAGLASVAYWVDEPVGYALTTSRDSGWLERNGAALYQSVRAQARDNASAF